jgi:hypothetical protein
LDEGGGRGDRKTQCIREIFGMQVEDRHWLEEGKAEGGADVSGGVTDSIKKKGRWGGISGSCQGKYSADNRQS